MIFLSIPESDNTRMLPSISNLLISSPYTATAVQQPQPPPTQQQQSDPPILNLSPASPVLSLPSTPPHNAKSPSFLSLDDNRRYSTSPVLSPISSPSSSPYLNGIRYLSLGTNSNDTNPPLEGDDPPQRLRLPSPSLSSTSSSSSPISPKSLFNTNSPPWNNASNTRSTNKIAYHHSPSPSCSSTSSSVSFEDASCASIESSPSAEPLLQQQQQQQPSRRSNTTNNTVSPIPNTQIVFDSSGQPILKRRRGRPPTCNNNFEGGGWTFLTPTVWDIHVSEEQKERELKADQEILLKSKQQQQQQQQQQLQLLDESNMNDSMNAFTNSNMDTILQMPRKKRGRKPKTHIAGNSCFVWKDLTSTRSSSKQQ
ncbi:unnamed protein product [Mucor hiemalis]